MIPSPWVGLVLTLACFRLVRLVGWDDFPPVMRARFWLTRARFERKGTYNAALGGSQDQQQVTVSYGRPLLMKFLTCAYCFGFWVSLAVYLLWVWFPTETVYGSAPFALSAAVGMIAVRDP